MLNLPSREPRRYTMLSCVGHFLPSLGSFSKFYTIRPKYMLMNKPRSVSSQLMPDPPHKLMLELICRRSMRLGVVIVRSIQLLHTVNIWNQSILHNHSSGFDLNAYFMPAGLNISHCHQCPGSFEKEGAFRGLSISLGPQLHLLQTESLRLFTMSRMVSI